MDTSQTRSVRLTIDGKPLEGELTIPSQPAGLVQVVTGATGAPKATFEEKLTSQLNELRLATLVVDLISPDEAHDRSVRSDTDMLCQRLETQREWLEEETSVEDLPTTLCGIDTGAAAVVEHLASGQREVEAVAFLNGRLDIVEDRVSSLDVPQLFFVDTSHEYLLDANRAAYRNVSVSPQAKDFLHSVDQDAILPVSRWLQSQVNEGETPMQEDEGTDSLHSAH